MKILQRKLLRQWSTWTGDAANENGFIDGVVWARGLMWPMAAVLSQPCRQSGAVSGAGVTNQSGFNEGGRGRCGGWGGQSEEFYRIADRTDPA